MLESPRYLVQKKEMDKAIKVLAHLLSWSKHELPPGRLVTQDEKEDILKQAKDNPSINTSYDVSHKIIGSTTTTKHRSYGSVNGDCEAAKTTPDTSHSRAKVAL